MEYNMKVIFAQGNPGLQYANSRHNVGFTMIDHLAKIWHIEFTKKTKFHAEIAEGNIAGEKILLVKPTTFYNETGQSARLITDFYKLDPTEDILVIHDDLALPFGTIRTRNQGSDAGNNGIKSLNAHLGTSYSRIRIGIYNPKRDIVPDADFVLSMFSKVEQDAMSELHPFVERFTEQFIKGTFETTKVRIPSVVDTE
jgi:PTH1 family peptidyl-tRNA hydrolase